MTVPLRVSDAVVRAIVPESMVAPFTVTAVPTGDLNPGLSARTL